VVDFFGSLAIYHRLVVVVLPLEGVGADDGGVRIEATYQGCAEAGFCYPPMNKTVEFRLPAV
jgi:thiol:disulfide interchange protein DsbD